MTTPVEKPYAYEVTMGRFDGSTEKRIYAARRESEAIRKARLVAHCETIVHVEPMSEKTYRAVRGHRRALR